MRVPATGADTIGLIKPRLCNTNDAIPSETFDGLKLRCDDAFPNKTLDEVRTQQWLDQVDSTNATALHGDNKSRKLLEVYLDGDEFPKGLRLRTPYPSLNSGRKLLLDALVPPLRELLHQCSDPSFTEIYPDGKSSCPTPNTGRVQKHKSHINSSNRKKRSPIHHFTSAGKRLKPSSTHSLDQSTSLVRVASSETDVENPNILRPDDLGSDDSDDDEGKEVLEEETERLRIDQKDKIAEYYTKVFIQFGQALLKNIMKVWIRLKEPGKQCRHPYNGGKKKNRLQLAQVAQVTPRLPRDPNNPGRDTAPAWWPNQDGWRLQDGTASRHREPDHLNKPERLFLSPILLRMTCTPTDTDRVHYTVDRLKEATDFLSMRPEQSKLLEELYHIREQEQQFEEGGIDGDTIVYVRKAKPHPPRTKRKPVKKASEKAKLKGERGRTPGPLAQLASTQFASAPPASDTGSAYSSLTPTYSPITVKSEHESQSTEYTGATQAPLPQYGATAMSDETFDAMTSAANAEFSDIVASNSQLQQSRSDLMQVDPHFLQATPGCSDPTMGGPAAYPLPISAATRELPIRNLPDFCGRSASVQRYDSPSYTPMWPSQTNQYQFNDDTIFGRFRMPSQSVGRPLEPLPIPITAPNNHPHGLPPHIQQPLCASMNCQNGHTHGWRPAEEQHHECVRSNCAENPCSHPLVFSRPGEQLSNQQFFEPNFDGFLSSAADTRDFSVTKSFP